MSSDASSILCFDGHVVTSKVFVWIKNDKLRQHIKDVT